MTKKITRNSVFTDSRMIGATVHMLDGSKVVIKGRPSKYSYSIHGSRTRIYAYRIKADGNARNRNFEQVPLAELSLATSVSDMGGYARYEVTATPAEIEAREDDLSSLLLDWDGSTADGTNVEARVEKYVHDLLRGNLFRTTAANGSAGIDVDANVDPECKSIRLTINLYLGTPIAIAQLTADKAFEELQKLGHTIHDLRRMSDDDLMSSYIECLTSEDM